MANAIMSVRDGVKVAMNLGYFRKLTGDKFSLKLLFGAITKCATYRELS